MVKLPKDDRCGDRGGSYALVVRLRYGALDFYYLSLVATRSDVRHPGSLVFFAEAAHENEPRLSLRSDVAR